MYMTISSSLLLILSLFPLLYYLSHIFYYLFYISFCLSTSWVEHARWFPRCAFLRQTKGQPFIDAVRAINALNVEVVCALLLLPICLSVCFLVYLFVCLFVFVRMSFFSFSISFTIFVCFFLLQRV